MNYKRILFLLFTAGVVVSIAGGCGSKETAKTLKKVEHYEATAGSVGSSDKSNNDKSSENDTNSSMVAQNGEDSEKIDADNAKTPMDMRTPEKVKGIYVTGPKAGSSDMENLISLVDETELNTMVIDIKNDSGEVTYKMDNEMVLEVGAAKNYIQDIKTLVQELKKKDIYLIARIVAFKDPILAEAKPEFALKTKEGKVFRDKSDLAWVNPYNKGVWDYLLEVAKEAVALGFDEVQFDYIRFSTDSKMSEVDFGEDAKTKTKEEVITEFTKYMYENLAPLGVYVSADVYGIVINSKIDQQIVGQNYKDMAENLDYICPMIYPSHYADGSFGVEHPDLDPYTIVKEALNESVMVLDGKTEEVKSDLTKQEADNKEKDEIDSQEKTEVKTEDNSEERTEDSAETVANAVEEDKKTATVRPWLQDFTASWLPHHQTYDKEAIKQQIQAVEDAGYEEWILWNGSNHYTRLD